MKCEHEGCNVDADLMFYCKYCRGTFCEYHKSPQNHNCKNYYQYHQQPGQDMQDLLKNFVTGFTSGQSSTRRRSNFYSAGEEQRKKLIERRLKERPDLFSLGEEWVDILVGFTIIVIVFGFTQYIFNRNWWGFLTGGLLLATAFIPHELAHKYVAEKRGQFARYILWVRGMFFTLFTLLLGIGLVVPGFVAIVPLHRQMTKDENGEVAFAGPITNLIIGSVGFVLWMLTLFLNIPLPAIFAVPNIFMRVAQFNGLIALFNCIPLWQLDGRKILQWNKWIYFGLVLANLVLVIPTFFTF